MLVAITKLKKIEVCVQSKHEFEFKGKGIFQYVYDIYSPSFIEIWSTIPDINYR